MPFSKTALLITSAQNPKIKQALDLNHRRERDTSQLFIIEGYRELCRAQEAKTPIETLFFCPELFLGTNEKALIDRLSGHHYQCPEKLFTKISYRDRPDGLLAIARQTHRSLHDLEKLLKNKKDPFLVIAEGIEKPGNLGTILRSCDAMGADALLLCDQCTDLFNPNTVRASVGTLFCVPVIECSSEEALTFLRDKGIKVVAATPEATKPLFHEDCCRAVAIALGTEQYGLSEVWRKSCDVAVQIPMLGHADSLNVAMATTIMLYETRRQRNAQSH